MAVIIAVIVIVWMIPTFMAMVDRDLFLWFTTSRKTVKLPQSPQGGPPRLLRSLLPTYTSYSCIRMLPSSEPALVPMIKVIPFFCLLI